MIQPVRFGIPKMETWKPDKEDIMFTNAKNIVCAPVKEYLRLDNDSLNYFVIRPKKSYNSQELRDHLCQVLNYFEKYFDPDKELFVCLSRIKYMIDNIKTYKYDDLINDIRLYILSNTIKQKVITLCEYNYELDLKYKNIQAPLQYDNCHAKQLLEMSVLMNFVIPLITHFAHTNRVQDIDEFILDVYDIILNMFPANMFSKLYETSYSNVSKSEYKNAVLWNKQDIRGKDVVTHSQESVNNIVLNIMPKYAFDRNIVALNYTSIAKNTSCQITDIGYEFGFVPLSSSKRDGEDNTSDTDKYEMGMIKQNEGIYLQSRVNARETISRIDSLFGPFDEKEIVFQREHLRNAVGNYQNLFQRQLILRLFYKYFGDTDTSYCIDPSTDYIKLMLTARNMLLKQNFMIMPYVLCGKVEKLVPRKTINKKEEKDMMSSKWYPMVVDKYRDPKVIQEILSTYATIISSTFRIVDMNNSEINGRIIETIPQVVMEEVLLMSLMS